MSTTNTVIGSVLLSTFLKEQTNFTFRAVPNKEKQPTEGIMNKESDNPINMGKYSILLPQVMSDFTMITPQISMEVTEDGRTYTKVQEKGYINFWAFAGLSDKEFSLIPDKCHVQIEKSVNEDTGDVYYNTNLVPEDGGLTLPIASKTTNKSNAQTSKAGIPEVPVKQKETTDETF